MRRSRRVTPDEVARGSLAGRGEGRRLPDSEPQSLTGLEEGDDASDRPPVAGEPDSNPAPAAASEAAPLQFACQAPLRVQQRRHRAANYVFAAILFVSLPKLLGDRNRINALL